MTLTADAHVHSGWSWDAPAHPSPSGSLVRICERAVRIVPPAIVFSEHLDSEDSWRAEGGVGSSGFRLEIRPEDFWTLTRGRLLGTEGARHTWRPRAGVALWDVMA